MSYKRYRSAAGRKSEAPEECPYTQVAMLALHRRVIEENRRQKVKKYSLRDERGESFSLAYWSDYERQEHVLVPAGTPITEGNLARGLAELEKAMEDTDLGRWTGEDRERAMEAIRTLVAELGERAKAEDELEARTLERDDLARQVRELEAKPVEVAVKEPDPEEVQRRVDAAVKEATRELKAESKNLRSQLKEAKARAEGLAKEVADGKKTAAEASEAAAERDRLREEIKELEKRLTVADAAVAAVNVHFETVQVEFGKLSAGLAAIGNEVTREKVRGAVVQLLDNFRAEIGVGTAASETAARGGET